MSRPYSNIEWMMGNDPIMPDTFEALASWLHNEPWHVDGWHIYAHHCETNGNLDAAIDGYSRAIELAHRYHPMIHFDHAALHYQEALILHGLARTEAANHAVQKAIFQDHQLAPALYIMAHGWEHPPAFTDYHTPYACYVDKWSHITRHHTSPALTSYHDRHDAWVRAYQAHHLDEAQAISDAMPDASLCASGWLYRSLMHTHHGAWGAALDAIGHALTLHSTHHKHYHYGASLHYLDRGRCWVAQQDYPLAYMDAIRACDIDVTHAEAKLFLITVQKALGV